MMGGIEAGKAFVKFLLEDSQFKKSLAGIGTKLTKIGKIGAAVTGPLIAGFTACAVAFGNTGAHLDDLSKRTGVTGGALSELSYAAQQSGTNIDVVANALSKMQKGMGAADPTKFGETLAALGLDMERLKGQLPEEQFTAIADAIARVPDAAQRAAAAQKIFGGAAKDLLPLLVEGKDGIDALRRAGIDLGVTMSTEQTQAAAAFDDAMSDLKQQLMGVANQLGGAIAPALTQMAEDFKPIIASIIEWIKNNPELVVTIAKVTAVMGGLSLAAIGVGTALTFISLHPIVAFLTLVAAAVAHLVLNFDNMKDRMLEIIAIAVPFGSSLKAGLKAFEDATGKKLFGDGLKDSDLFGGGGSPTAAGVPALPVPPEIAAIDQQAKALQAQLTASMPTAQNVTMDAATIKTLDDMLGVALERTAGFTERSAEALEKLLAHVMKPGGGFRVGSG
jgi:TP901 family phage tail tape measure protein